MNKGLKSKSIEKENFFTPKYIFDEYNTKYGYKIIIDACTSENNPLNTPYFFTKETNGLDHKKWIEIYESINKGKVWPNIVPCNIWINPPYIAEEISKWLDEAIKYTKYVRMEQVDDQSKVFILLPVFTDTTWFHQYINPYIKGKTYEKLLKTFEIDFIKGRIKFVGKYGKPIITIDKNGKKHKYAARFPSMVITL